jgi:hypothetical protein
MSDGAKRTRDFGSTGERPRFAAAARTAWSAVAGVAVLAAGGLVAAQHWREQQQDEAFAERWSVTGPPCPAVTAKWVQELALEQRTQIDFEGVDGFMANGAVSCVEVDYFAGRQTRPYPVCQFSAPFVLGLRVGGRPAYFEPGIGRPATVSLRNGRLSCVIGAKLTDWWSDTADD